MLMNLYEFKEDLNKRGVFFCFSGPVSQDLLVEIGATLKQKMKLEEARNSTALRVFSMVVEQAQNIIHYSAEKCPQEQSLTEATGELSIGIIAVGYEGERYFVLSGNRIYNKDVGRLREKLSGLQKMDRDALKKLYRLERKKGPGPGSKGAGLGFIDMAKKACKPIEFDFKKIDEKFSFFSSKIVI